MAVQCPSLETRRRYISRQTRGPPTDAQADQSTCKPTMFYSAVYQPSNNLCDSGSSAAGKASAYGCINPGSIFRTGAVLGCNPVVLTRSNRPFYAFDSAATRRCRALVGRVYLTGRTAHRPTPRPTSRCTSRRAYGHPDRPTDRQTLESTDRRPDFPNTARTDRPTPRHSAK